MSNIQNKEKWSKATNIVFAGDNKNTKSKNTIIQLVVNSKESGFSLQQIQTLTNLSVDEINHILEQNSVEPFKVYSEPILVGVALIVVAAVFGLFDAIGSADWMNTALLAVGVALALAVSGYVIVNMYVNKSKTVD